jgi:hypothetical protein
VKTLLGLPLLLAFELCSAAGPPPPALPFKEKAWAATLTKKPITWARFGNLRIQFEKTTLGNVRSAAAVGQVEHAGDAGESNYWLCYTLAGKKPARVWISSHGEMGGPEHAITGITATELESAEAVPGCPSLPSNMQPVSLSAAVWLGTLEATLQEAVGPPSHREGEWLSYDFQGKSPGKCQDGFDVLNWMTLKTKNRAVEAIYVGQVTSC